MISSVVEIGCRIFSLTFTHPVKIFLPIWGRFHFNYVSFINDSSKFQKFWKAAGQRVCFFSLVKYPKLLRFQNVNLGAQSESSFCISLAPVCELFKIFLGFRVLEKSLGFIQVVIEDIIHVNFVNRFFFFIFFWFAYFRFFF